MKNQNGLRKLYRQLLQFGLDPNEWIIQPVSHRLYEITKIDDPEFRFLGRLKDSNWATIWLASV